MPGACRAFFFFTIPQLFLFLLALTKQSASKNAEDIALSDFIPFYWRPPRRQGLCSQSAHFWAPKKASDEATSNFVPLCHSLDERMEL